MLAIEAILLAIGFVNTALADDKAGELLRSFSQFGLTLCISSYII